MLMLENRSYDNIFGWSDLQGLTPDGVPTRADGLSGKPQFVNIGVNGNACSVDKDAPYQLNVDLGHEFLDVLVQMSGNPDAAMSKGQYPTLARQRQCSRLCL
ncbi:alkaline phosphatase family protein [Ralstonia solanacearum]|uniref:alkaline phosphatase family protein n=1 Tax=Ralstonia solanacearum TaxID=305 RepID=UPI00202A5B42|nr:alkaline phosphatase family protein [Ralstonia solanacearum]MDC6256174.1 alkaline phosphatase family protein [Ralstonia solanacearum]MDC6260809.1 alkaline phosphatase family protein [Ralstonia solanacearum]MDC6302433.1 alkaline phosphatase family protein [Ralstonia solanacearum]